MIASWITGISRDSLYPYRPRFTNRAFWAVQALVIAVAGIHALVELYGFFDRGPGLADSDFSFVPVALFFIPVVYAALNFGLAGSLATGLWCAVISLPNLVLLHHGVARVGESFQIGVVVAVGVFVGERVDRELAARRRAEAIGLALKASEAKYRQLFESSPVAILLLDAAGVVLEANPAAVDLFGAGPAAVRGRAITGLLDPQAAWALLGARAPGGEAPGHVVLCRDGRQPVYLEPTLTVIHDGQGRPVTQTLLRDVTAELQREAGLRAYAARILNAQEEAHKRVAQELHDQTIQDLVLLCRQLDLVESQGDLSTRAVSELRAARRSAEEIVGGLRAFARALRPPTLDDLGLASSIRRLVLDLGERSGVEGELSVVGAERRLPPDAELALFRIAQESLHNVEHHARAGHVAVSLTFGAADARLTVTDDGVGFALTPGADLAASGHLGLLGMRERAQSLGGRIEIHSGPGRGTEVDVVIPLDQPAATIAGQRSYLP